MDELDMLRDQMAAMKSDLDKNAIINDRLMQTVMKERSKGLNRLVNAEIISIPFLILLFFGICHVMHLSIWILVTMAIGLIVSTVVDIKTVKVSTRLINSLSLRDLRTYLIRQKRQRTIQLIVELPLGMAWLVWLLLSLFDNSMVLTDLRDMNNQATVVWIKFAIIMVTSIIAIFTMIMVYREAQNVNDSMIEEIESNE